jgi:hypothetical protein
MLFPSLFAAARAAPRTAPNFLFLALCSMPDSYRDKKRSHW